jgi:hypothetical protein
MVIIDDPRPLIAVLITDDTHTTVTLFCRQSLMPIAKFPFRASRPAYITLSYDRKVLYYVTNEMVTGILLRNY